MVTGDAFSITGILTMAFVVLSGPITFFVISLRNKGAPPPSEEVVAARTTNRRLSARSLPGVTDGREVIDDTAYLLSLLGFAIGIGNLWRFPYLVGKYGGGAFVLAYLVCLFFVSMPAFMIEMVMGQYTRQSTINCFKKILPGAAGLGYAQLVMCGVILVYYNILLVYAIIYMFGSLYTPLPWTATSPDPNVPAADYFWKSQVLNLLTDEEKKTAWLGSLNPPLVYGLAFVWAFIFLALAFGKEVLAKITWVTVVGPVVMLAIILCRVLFLDGAWDGIQFYIFKFDSKFLYDPDVWAIACGQILFSLSPGMGTAITFSSFTTPKANVFRTCIQVALANSLFSLTGGFAIFSIVGNITYRINEKGGIDGVLTTVSEQAGAGPGLTFITMADAMQFFGWGSNIISVLFFTTLFALGLDSSFALIETFVSTVEDIFFDKFGRKPNRIGLVFVCCAGFFVVGLLHATSRGLDLLDVFDHFVTSYFLLFGVAMEGLLFTFYFGFDRMKTHLKLTTHGNSETPKGQDVMPSILWKFAIGVTMPLFSFVLFLQLFWGDIRMPYGKYEAWLNTIGWLQLVTLMLITFVVGIVQFMAKPKGDLPPLADDEGRLYTVQNVGGAAPLAGAGGTELGGRS